MTAELTTVATSPKTSKAKTSKKPTDSKIKFDGSGRRITLRSPQIAILKALRATKSGSMPRPTLADKCPGVGLSEHLGTLDGTKNKWTVSLVEQKYARYQEEEVSGGNSQIVVYITAAGRKALEQTK